MPDVKAKYKCTEAELYAIANLAFNNLDYDRLAFAAKKPKYDPPFVLSLRGLRTTAMNLPDEESRNGVHQTLKNQLPPLVEVIRDNFNDLKGYIRDGWPNEDPVPRYEAAGLIRYNNIGKENWEEVVELNTSMTNFISGNSGALTAPGGMVAGFALKVTTDSTNFDNVYNPFMSSKETGTATAAKVTANNDLYDNMMAMMKDGVEMVFRTDTANRKRYVFATLKDLVSPPGSASLKVTLKVQGTNAPLPNTTVTIQAEDGPLLSGSSDANGEVSFDSIDPARYLVRILAASGTIELTKEVDTGVNARLEVEVPVP